MRVRKLLLFLVIFNFGLTLLRAQIINTIAGVYYGSITGNGIPATDDNIGEPFGVAVDDSGNVYIAEASFQIGEVNRQGIINKIAGNGFSGYTGDGGPATAAKISRPIALAVDDSGNIYISDEDNDVIRKVNTAGIINTFAGGGTNVGTDGLGDGGPATGALFDDPRGIVVDHIGNVYVADWSDNRVREINTSGIINTIAGMAAAGYSGDGGAATEAEIYQPFGVVIDDSGNIYFGDAGNNRVRKINTSGIITTFAGNGSPANYSGDGGPATAAELSSPFGVAVDDSMNVYISDFNHSCIREVNTSGIINTVAGEGPDGLANGIPATDAGMFYVYGITVDAQRNIYIGDGGDGLVRKVTVTLDLALVISNVSCTGGNNGNVSVTAYEVPPEPPYSYVWSPGGQTDTVISGLSAGTYTVTVTDNKDSTYSTTFIITQPPVLSVSDSIINLTCFGLSEANAIVTPSGGTTPYTYLWSDGNSQTTTISTGLSAGTYSVTVSDSCGTSVTSSVIIPQKDTLKISASLTSPTCYGESNGEATAIVIWGNPPFTYLWSDANSQTTATATGLSAGNYTIIVTDTCGTMETSSVTITHPGLLTDLPTVISNIHCNGINTGSLYANVTGGTLPYTYFWEWYGGGSSNTDTLTGLSAGTYTIIVNDNNGCTVTDSAIITQPPAIAQSTTIINPLNNCTGGNNGSIYLSVIGGVPPFTYLWSDPNHQTTDTATGLSAGNYTVTVTDNTGCSSFASNTFTLPNILSDSINIISNVSCYGGNNGSATVMLAGGDTVVRSYSFEPVVQHFAVPPGINTISINIGGAQGGGSGGGDGASFSGVCLVIPGQILSVAVGQEGGFWETYGNGAGGGGGASWIYDSSIILYSPSGTTGLIAVAAGGGGEGLYASNTLHVTYAGNTGGINLVANGTTFYGSYGNNGGTGGNGGGEYGAAGGAGWLSNGENGSHGASGGMDEANHFASVPGYYASGGFGGGGGSGWGTNAAVEVYIGGGGGGYNGGGGGGGDGGEGGGGGGGGSYFINTSPIVTATDTGNGFVTISYTVGGIPPYTYLWSNGETIITATGLSAGTYTVTVTDSSGCSATASATITQPPAISITADSINVTGTCNGSAWAMVSGGNAPYTYFWTGGLTTDTITNQCANYYCCTVTDAIGCMDSACVTIGSSISTGTNQLTMDNGGLTVYPNPNNGTFTLDYDMNVSGYVRINIINELGQVVYDDTEYKNTGKIIEQLNFDNLASGIYSLRMQTDVGIAVRKLAIIRRF